MRKTSRNGPPIMPISKEKLKDRLTILEVAQKYSPKINERTRRPLIICPFHEDRNLGSCRIFPETNTFKCEACGAHGDTLKLASGYLDIDLSDMNDLLEKIVKEFEIPVETVRVDYTPGAYKSQPPPPERLTSEEYTELLTSDHYSIPINFKEVGYEEGVYDYVPCESMTVYYRTLAVKDPEFHDWVICTVSRIYWLRYAHMLMYCQKNGYSLLETVIEEKMKNFKNLLQKGLIDKSLFRPELRLRNELLNDDLRASA